MFRVKALLLTLALLPIALMASNNTDDNLNNPKKQLQHYVGFDEINELREKLKLLL